MWQYEYARDRTRKDQLIIYKWFVVFWEYVYKIYTVICIMYRPMLDMRTSSLHCAHTMQYLYIYREIAVYFFSFLTYYNNINFFYVFDYNWLESDMSLLLFPFIVCNSCVVYFLSFMCLCVSDCNLYECSLHAYVCVHVWVCVCLWWCTIKIQKIYRLQSIHTHSTL